MKLVIAAAAVFALALPASAQPGGNSSSQPQNGQAAPAGQCVRGQTLNGEPCVCRRVQVESSSRIAPRTTCRTPTQWRQVDRDFRF